MTPESGADHTADAFLGGAVTVRQPKTGYRAGMDAVMLGAAVPAHAGDIAVEFGTGAGTASLCLLQRVAGVAVIGVEANAALTALANENAKANGFGGRFGCVQGRLPRLPKRLEPNSIGHVFFNPPFGHSRTGTVSPDPAKAQATAVLDGDAEDWIAPALKLLRQGGCLTLVHRADALADVLGRLSDQAGAIEIIPLWPRAGVAANRIIVRARKGRRTPLTLRAGLILHTVDGGFTPEAEAILRHGAGLYV